jgi:hypothetical protein
MMVDKIMEVNLYMLELPLFEIEKATQLLKETLLKKE